MNNIVKLSVFFAASATLLAACNKVSETPEPFRPGEAVMRVTIPSDVTKVSLTDQTSSGGGMALAWAAGDALRVISGETSELYSIKDGFSGHVAEFTGAEVGGTSFDILYPGSVASLAEMTGKSYAGQTQDGNGSTAHLAYHAWLTGVDAYKEVAFSPDWAAAHGGALHQNGVLKLVITLPGNMTAVSKVALVAPSELFKLDNAGTVASTELALNLQNVDVSASGQVLTAYMNIPAQDIALAAGQQLSVKVTGADNAEYTQEFTVANDVVMQGGKLSIIRLEPEVVEVLTDSYVSLSGAGEKTGADWDNALDLNQFKALVRTKEDAAQAALQAAALDGVTFHFADGTYVLPDEEHPSGFKIEFNGYSKQVEMTFTGSADAILSGGGLYRVMTLGNQVKLTVNGMTVKDGSREEESGAGILVAAGASGNATLALNQTVFAANNAGTVQSGGALRCSKGTITATDCVFEADNYARNGGSIFTNDDKALVTFTGCTFKSHSTNTGGAANNSKGVQHFVNCIFDGCYTETGNGGAIHANAADCVITFDGCQFKGCKARVNDLSETSTNKGAGIISLQQADVTINDCLFENCEATTGALVYLQAGGTGPGSGGWFKCNNTRFIGNKAADRGLVQCNGSKSNTQAAIGFFNNCVFYNNTMRTNQWGFILHGGNPGIACFNNCTIYGNTRQQEGGNGVLLNTDGVLVFTNSTLIGAADLVAVRNTDSSNNARVLLANSLIINTSSIKTPLVFGPFDKMKCPLYVYNNIMGPVVDETDVSLTGRENIYDAALEGLGDVGFDTEKYVFTWKGPADTFEKITPAGFETAVKESLEVKFGDFNGYIGSKSLGQFYYGWLAEIGAIGKDAAGTSRGSAWWPGAYQE